MTQEDFTKAGFTVVETDCNDNSLLSFVKEHYPSIIKDNEINLAELKAILGLPIDEKVNGYGLNFVGRNVARAKYAKKTDKELQLNTKMSKDSDSTQNLVLKGDNLDSLKILKNHYSGKIKCIYIDPPYNTSSDEFVYPDKFNKEEAEVLGLANLSESDFARMEFSFKSKKSHNGWLSFMYPRLLLARDLLSKDGVIFISIDDNEQANLKLICDEIFGEENFVANIIWEKKYTRANDAKWFSDNHDHLLVYGKLKDLLFLNLLPRNEKQKNAYSNPDKHSKGLWKATPLHAKSGTNSNGYTFANGIHWEPPYGTFRRFNDDAMKKMDENDEIWFGKDNNQIPSRKSFLSEVKEGITPVTIWKYDEVGHNHEANNQLKELQMDGVFSNPKPTRLIMQILKLATDLNSTILDFFAGSGTTGHAVMQLNADDGGKRKFILCQIDEPIKKDKPAYQFCLDNNLPPVISSITIERLNRAGAKISDAIKAENEKNTLFEDKQKNLPDICFKVFDSVEAPKLELDETSKQVIMKLNANDALSRIYNMIFTIGLDEPTQTPEEVVKDCIYKIGKHYYVTNSEKITPEQLSNAIKNGKVFIDGWTASLNTTLQNYKEDVKIVF